MLPDFNRLKVFYFIYLSKSVAAASKELHISQSAVSQHLAKLEREIETRLFTRLHKKLVPTSAGDRLFEILRPFISNLQGTLKEIQQEKQGPSGILRVGAPVEFGERYLPEVFNTYRQTYPDVRFQLELGHPSVLLPLLKEGQLDILFADIYAKQAEYSRDLTLFQIDPVLDERLVLVCSNEYYVKFLAPNPSLERLLPCDYIAYQPHAPALKSWFKHHYNRESISLSIALTVESVQGVISATKLNMGLGLIPSHLIQDEIEHKTLIKISTKQKDLVNRISLVQLLDKIASPTEKWFIHYFMEHIKTIEIKF